MARSLKARAPACAVPATSASTIVLTWPVPSSTVQHRSGASVGPGRRRPFWTQVGRKHMRQWAGKRPLSPNTHPPACASRQTSPFAKAAQPPAKEGHPLATLQLPGPLSFPAPARRAPTSWASSPLAHCCQGHAPGFPGVSEQSPTTFSLPDAIAKLTP